VEISEKNIVELASKQWKNLGTVPQGSLIQLPKDKNGKAGATTLERGIGYYFDSDGYLVIEHLMEDLLSLMELHCGEELFVVPPEPRPREEWDQVPAEEKKDQ